MIGELLLVGGIGPLEIGIIILIIILLFGATKVPQLARSFGQAMGEFKKAKKEAELNYKKFEESVTVDEEEIPEAKAKTKGEVVNIKEVAAYMGIDTAGKTEEELKEEVQVKLEASSKSEKD
ncbi:MAG: Sec-independent protein translocase protein TatAt [Candidatus Methanophagaceae archaeon]|nr:MAG: Sec-independent protein translocase protein TatAt [Methanophagales archaeon]KAF5430178.1 sec-independent protein translocase protein TatA [Methanophagales archaeon]